MGFHDDWEAPRGTWLTVSADGTVQLDLFLYLQDPAAFLAAYPSQAPGQAEVPSEESSACVSASGAGPRLTMDGRGARSFEVLEETGWTPLRAWDVSRKVYVAVDADAEQPTAAYPSLRCIFPPRDPSAPRTVSLAGLSPGQPVVVELADEGMRLDQVFGESPRVGDPAARRFSVNADERGVAGFTYHQQRLLPALQPDLLGFHHVAIGLLAMGAAAVVLWSGSGRPIGRRLAALLAVEGIGAIGFGIIRFFPAGAVPGAILASAVLVLFLAPFVYIEFVSQLDTPATRWIRGWRKALVYVAAFLLLVVIVTLSGLGWNALSEFMLYGWFIALSSLPLVPAWQAWRRAPEGLARRRARAYLFAFGAHDAVLIVAFLMLAVSAAGWDASLIHVGAILLGLPEQPHDLATRAFMGILTEPQTPLALTVLLPLLAYAILKEQLFDADLRLRSAVDRLVRYLPSIPVGLAVFVGIVALGEDVLGEVAKVAGGSVAVLSTYAMANLKTLRGMGERLSAAIVPSATASAEERAREDLEKYRASVVELLHGFEGRLDEGARNHLRRLRERHGIPEAEAAQVESEAVAAPAPILVPG